MFLLGLLLPICFIPGYTGASIPTQWALLSLFLPAMVWRSGSRMHPYWIAFLCFAIIGQLWAPQPLDTIHGIWIMILWGLSFQLGYISTDLKPLLRGFAWGLSISSILAIFQWFGFTAIPVAYGNIAGLLYNRTILGSVSALLILALLHERLWLYIPMLLPGLILSGSRGGLVVLASGLASRLHWSLVVAPAALALAYWGISSSSDTERLLLWSIAYQGLSFWGLGAGSFIDIFIFTNDHIIHPEFVHNDYLQLIFELGIASIVPFAILAACLLWCPTPTIWGFTILACFYFPLYTPLTAFLGCLALGHSLRGFSPSSLIIRRRRPDLLPWHPDPRPEYDLNGREAVSIFHRTS